MAKLPDFVTRMRKPAPKRMSEWQTIFKPGTPEDEIVLSIMKKRDAVELALRETYRQWLINAAFTRGQQFHILRRNEDRLIRLKEPRGRKQIMDDMIGPWKRHQIANMVMAMPAFEAVPTEQNTQERTAARFGTHLLTHYLDTWRFVEQYIDLASYLIDFGNAFIYANYEPQTGKFESVPLINALTGDPVYDENGEVMYDSREYGDIMSGVLMPHSVLCLQDPSRLDEKPWVIIKNGRTYDYFLEHYENAEELTKEKDAPYHLYDIQNASSLKNDPGDPHITQFANELIYMQKPSPVNPDGMVCVVASGILLKPRGNRTKKVSVWPFANMNDYPLEHIHFPKESGEFFARAPVEPQIPLQKSLNLLWSTVIENAEQMGHTKWLVPEQSDIPYNFITDMPDVLRFTYPFKPEQSDIKPMPDYIAGGAIDRLKAAIRDVQNYHGASLGGSVSGVRSDAHAQNLQEQDLLPMSTVDTLLESAFERFGEKVLLIAAEKLETERLITYTDKSGRDEHEQFSGAMLGAGPHRVRVRLQNKHLRTKNATVQQIFGFFNAGLITDQLGNPDPIQAVKLLEFAIPGSVHEDFKMHSNIALNENQRLMRGEPVFVLPQQNHRIHISEHNCFMNSPEWYDMVYNPDSNAMAIMQAFNDHLAAHGQTQAAALGMLQQPMQGQAANGAGQGGGQQRQAQQNRATVNRQAG